MGTPPGSSGFRPLGVGELLGPEALVGGVQGVLAGVAPTGRVPSAVTGRPVRRSGAGTHGPVVTGGAASGRRTIFASSPWRGARSQVRTKNPVSTTTTEPPAARS